MPKSFGFIWEKFSGSYEYDFFQFLKLMDEFDPNSGWFAKASLPSSAEGTIYYIHFIGHANYC